MPPCLQKTIRSLFGLWLCVTLLGSAHGSTGEDPLKELVDSLSEDTPKPARAWIPVLETQRPKTIHDLWTVLRQDASPAALEAYRGILTEISRVSASEHTARPLDPQKWQSRIRLTVEIVDLIGKASQVENLLRLLAIPRHIQSANPSAYNPTYHSLAIQKALGSALERDSRVLNILGEHYGKTAPLVDADLLRAIGDCKLPDAGNQLSRMLGIRVAMDSTVLAQITSVLRQPEIRLSETALVRVRIVLQHGTQRARQEAIRVLGFADDVPSIQILIALLNATEPPIKREALSALHRITAMTIEGHADRWKFWFAEETEWWRSRAPRAIASLERADSAHIAETLRDLASKRLFRREITPAILPLLMDGRTEVVRMSLSTIEALRPPVAMVAGPLSELLDHPNPQIQTDASQVLTFLGGKPLFLEKKKATAGAR